MSEMTREESQEKETTIEEGAIEGRNSLSKKEATERRCIQEGTIKARSDWGKERVIKEAIKRRSDPDKVHSTGKNEVKGENQKENKRNKNRAVTNTRAHLHILQPTAWEQDHKGKTSVLKSLSSLKLPKCLETTLF